MRLSKLLNNRNSHHIIEIIEKISYYSNCKTDYIIEMSFSFWYKEEKLIFSDKFIQDYPYIYNYIEYIYSIITSTQYYRQKLFIDRIGYIVFLKNNFPLITIKDKSLIYNKSLVIDIGKIESELIFYNNNNKYWKLLLFSTFFNITLSSLLMYKVIKN